MFSILCLFFYYNNTNLILFNVIFSYSCGYQKAFDHYSSMLGDKYPDLKIIGANYDPSIMHLIGAKVLVC